MDMEKLPLQGKKVLVRVDFNVPFDGEGKIADSSRIEAALPTIRYLLGKNCKIVLMSHRGRPKGVDPKLSLKPVAEELSKRLNLKVQMAPDCIGPEVERLVQALKPGEVILLENMRFYPAEEKPETDPSFAKQLASLGEFYIDDAFGCAHRPHASIVGVAEILKGRSAAGLLLQKECAALSKLVTDPDHPFVALIGGAKVSSKLLVLKSLLERVDTFAIGGGMAFTFLKAQGFQVGSSLVEEDLLEEAGKFIRSCQEKGCRLLLPVDFVAGENPSSPGKLIQVGEEIAPGLKGMDIGPKTVALFKKAMNGARTLFWNGPMGVFESEYYAKGTLDLAQAFAASAAFTVAGGGETLSALQKVPGKERISHLSTGGGASLEFIESGTLPGVSVLH